MESHPHLAVQYGIHSIPTLLMFQDGQVVDQLVSIVPKQVLVDRLNMLLHAA